MLSEAKHLLGILVFVYFVKGDRGATCEAPPLSPLTIPQTPSRFLEVCAPHGLCHSPQRMRQRYAYGSNIAAVRCGWDVKTKEQWRIKNRNLQSGAVLWLCHSFACAFSSDSKVRLQSHSLRAKLIDSVMPKPHLLRVMLAGISRRFCHHSPLPHSKHTSFPPRHRPQSPSLASGT